MALAQPVSTARYTLLALTSSLLWASGFPAITSALRFRRMVQRRAARPAADGRAGVR